jgi:uncharacterized protein (TIGR00645 family)
MDWIKRGLELILFTSRWLIVPLLIGLIVGLAAEVYKFFGRLVEFIQQLDTASSYDVIVGMLKLIDLTLTANLVVIVICSSYENFVAPIDAAEHPKWPRGLTRISFSDLKQKVLGSIVAIAAVNVLEWFMDIEREVDSLKLAWVVGILLAFAVAMLILAIADRLTGTNHEAGH